MNEDYFAVALNPKESMAEGFRLAVALYQERHGALPPEVSMRADLALQLPDEAGMDIVIDERVALGSVYFRVSRQIRPSSPTTNNRSSTRAVADTGDVATAGPPPRPSSA